MKKYTLAFCFLALFFTAVTVVADAGHNTGKSAGSHWRAPKTAAQMPNPIAKDMASLQRGKASYLENCASCHGPKARGDGRFAKNLNPKPADLARMAGRHPDGDFAWKISNGRNTMPAWKGILKENEIWDLVNYIQSLAQNIGGQRPEKPTHH